MAENRFLNALNDSIDRLAQGQSIEDCAQAHPEFADQLRLYLALGQLTTRARITDAEVELAHTRIRANMDAALDSWDGFTSRPRFSPWIPVLLLVIVAPLLLFIGSRVLTNEPEIEPTAENIEVTAELVPPVTSVLTVAPTLVLSETATQPPPTNAASSPTPTRTSTSTVEPTATASETLPPTSTQSSQTTEDGACVASAPDGWISYRVRSGDTLSGLAAATGTTLDRVIAVNCIEDARFIVVGQAIFLPSEPAVSSGSSSDDSSGSGSTSGGDGNNNNDDDDDDDDGGDDDD